MKTTALIILNYNNAHDTRCCIESIQRYNTAPVKYIIVDNASRSQERVALRTDLGELFPDGYLYLDSKDAAPKHLPLVTLIETGANIGYARGNNVGLELAYADSEVEYVMILNNDILFVEDIVPGLISKLNSLADCAIISPVLYRKGLKDYDYNCARRNFPVSALTRRNFLHYWWQLRKKTLDKIYPDLLMLSTNDKTHGTIEIELPSGSCMLLKKDTFKSIGSFDPHTFLFFEENILYKKIQAKGLKNYLSLDERCIHLGASTMQAMPSSVFVMNASKESELYYVDRYSNASVLTKALHRLSVSFYRASFRLQKSLKS